MKRKQLAAGVILSLAIISGLSGCQSSAGTAASEVSGQTAGAGETKTVSQQDESGEITPVEITYDENDKNEAWSEEGSTLITCSGTSVSVQGAGVSESEGTVTITAAGTYIISGTLSDGRIIIDAGSEDVVHLVLNKASITSSEGAAIWGKQSGKLVITLAEGTENSVADGSSYSEQDEDGEPDAAIFSKDDITINGAGTLGIKGNYKNGIHGKDGVKVVGGTLNIDAVNHAVSGKDYVAVSGGTLKLSSGEDAVHSAADVWITDGDITIDAGDDGIHGDGVVTIDGGTVQIENSTEGIEGTVITINNGEISLTASDDGLNGADGTSDKSDDTAAGGFGMGMGGGMDAAQENVFVEINGGKLYVNAEGDGIDSNGSLSVTGGEITVDGPERGGNGIIDYNGTAEITGGTIIAAGTSDMAQTFSENSGQYSLLYIYNEAQSKGTELSLKDSSGNTVASFTPSKEYAAVIISVPKMTKGETYTLYSGSTKVENITLDAVNTTAGAEIGQAGPGGMSGGMGERGMPGGQMPEGQTGEKRPF
ncbi:MAG: carbohydrate-binding domain-containing protein [Muricomes sp.]